MEAKKRDELLIRIDERTHIIKENVAEIKEGQRRQNGSILRNTIYRKITLSVGGMAITALVLLLIGVY